LLRYGTIEERKEVGAVTLEDLLEQLERLSHAERVRIMIDLGRRNDSESQALIAELAQGGFYERYMALYSCFGSRNREQVLRALADPSRLIRGLALRLVPIVCDEAALRQVLESAPAQVYQPLLWKLRQRKQQAIIDAFLERLAARDEAQFFRLLAFGSPELIARLAGRFQQAAAPGDWTKLARFHPTLALDLLQRWADAAAVQDNRLVQYVNALLPLLVRGAADEALALVKSMLRTTPLGVLRLHPLVQQRPAEMGDLALGQKSGGSLGFTQVVGRLTVKQILGFFTHNAGAIGWYYSWFRRLSPELRLAVYTAGARRFRYKGTMPTEVVAWLPRLQREQEARRAIARSRQNVPNRLDYARFLPWDEALKQIDPSLHASEIGIRQKALMALIDALKYQRSHLLDALAILRTYRTEHDPIRRVIFQALASLPLSIWREEHLNDLGEIIRHGLNDVGLSPETHQAILTLLFKLLPAHLDWSAAQLATVLRERGLPTSPRGQTSALPSTLAADQSRRLATFLLPVLRTWLEREKEAEILNVMGWLKLHRQAFDELLPLLEELLQRTRTLATAQSILTAIAAQRFDRFQALVPALVEDDPSWLTLSNISSYLLLRRQERLAPFLRFQSYAGRWSTGSKRFLLPLPKRFAGGTTRQQEAYADALMEIINDETQESQMLTSTVKTLPLLPAVSPARLAALANDPRSVVRTTALFALGRLDTDQGLPTLIEALQDARARIAIPALRSFLLKMPAPQALAIIRSIPMNRVTVAKERVRLTGEVSGEEAYQELLALERRKLHRDVRIALLRVLSGHVTRSATWPILEEAARSPEVEMALAALPRNAAANQLEQPVEDETETIEQHLLRLMVLLLQHPESAVRISALHSSWLGIQDQQRLLLRRALELLRSPVPAESQAAAHAIVTLCREADGPAIAQSVRDLLSNRKALITLTGILQSTNLQDRQRLLPVVRQIVQVLAEDPLMVNLRVRLAFFTLPMEELIALFQSLSERNELHAEVLMRTCQMMREQYGLTDWEPIEAAFATSADERLRRLAFAALEAHSAKQGSWDEARLARLQTYRADPSPLVAAAAAFTFPNEEGEDDDLYDDGDHWEGGTV
jgi:HEAT repeat protein